MESRDGSGRAPNRHLPTALQLHILSFLPPNDRALSGRLLSPDAAAALSEDPTCTASLSQLLSPTATPWAVEAGRQHVRQLPFRHKLQLLCSAAASGSEANLEVARALLQPSIFPGQLQHVTDPFGRLDPGVAAAKAGHVHLLSWLMRHCPGMVSTSLTLDAAARYCDLAGLQAAVEALRQEGAGEGCADGSRGEYQGPAVCQTVLNAAADSATPDAVAKMEWLLTVGGGRCSLRDSETAAFAVRSGDRSRLWWLRERGCPMGEKAVVWSALQHADLAVVQWLVDEAGCTLPAPAGQAERWEKLLAEAVRSPDGVTKLQWLQERGAPPLGGDSTGVLKKLVRFAAEAGQAEAVRRLLSGLEPAAARDAAQSVFGLAVGSGCIRTAEALIQAGATASHRAYTWIAASAHRTIYQDCRADGDGVAMVRWLAREAQVSAVRLDLPHFIRVWPNDTPADSRGLLQAVQLLVGEAGCRKWDAKGGLTAAAARGELALVQYLLRHRPRHQPGWEVLVAAAEGGCEALLQWLVGQHPGCMEGAGSSVSPYVSAVARGDLGTLTALRALGVPWGADDVVAQAVRRGCSVPALRWLKEQGAPVGRSEEED